jgi:hypothetical protein
MPAKIRADHASVAEAATSTARNDSVFRCMSATDQLPDPGLLRPAYGSKCKPQIVHDPYPRVTDWGMPEDVHAGDFTFSVLEAALQVGGSEIQLTPLESFGEVSVHFKIGSEFIRQRPLTQVQFGFIAILLAYIATPSSYHPASPHQVRYFYTKDGTQYYIRFSKIRVADNNTAILIRLFVTDEASQQNSRKRRLQPLPGGTP